VGNLWTWKSFELEKALNLKKLWAWGSSSALNPSIITAVPTSQLPNINQTFIHPSLENIFISPPQTITSRPQSLHFSKRDSQTFRSHLNSNSSRYSFAVLCSTPGFLLFLKDFFISSCSYHELWAAIKKVMSIIARAHILNSIWLFNFAWFIDSKMVSAESSGWEGEKARNIFLIHELNAINLLFVRCNPRTWNWIRKTPGFATTHEVNNDQWMMQWRRFIGRWWEFADFRLRNRWNAVWNVFTVSFSESVISFVFNCTAT
jgi:hypothetical protein